MTSLESIIHAIIEIPIEYVANPARPWCRLLSHLYDVLTGFGFDPTFAIVIIIATPILAVSLIAEIVKTWRVLHLLRSPTPEATPATDAATSIDNDWADIAAKLREENRNV
ncbi:hypothetical protein A8A54_04395 [Brucella pseudogrignonensis]|uniref:hypothetical protein n=1 Tax=Brucella pseudogrignonensis TaxID=419475 RepID=UPI0007DA65A4|nr:hypothetical protein [Brucella pseudogrignonensis]ANG95791.1 hypothetical protein A8A54_04395 [Brucella pseudogrignonensis]